MRSKEALTADASAVTDLLSAIPGVVAVWLGADGDGLIGQAQTTARRVVAGGRLVRALEVAAAGRIRELVLIHGALVGGRVLAVLRFHPAGVEIIRPGRQT